MATLDTFLGTAIPIGVIVVFLGLIYWKLQEPVNFIAKKLWHFFMIGMDNVTDSLSGNVSKEIIYK